MPEVQVALVSPEAAPFAKSGGLADAVSGLAGALPRVGVRPVVVLPRYGWISTADLEQVDDPVVSVGREPRQATAWLGGGLGDGEVDVLLVDLPEYFGRPALYGEGGKDYEDNLARFSAFCRAALQLVRRLRPDCRLFHAHDWQAALLPLLFKTEMAGEAVRAGLRSVLTVHNISYQGVFPPEQLRFTGLEGGWLTPRYLEFHGDLNLLKGGMVSADRVTTVSPTYAREVRESGLGFGLEGVLQDRGSEFVGILNGIDVDAWDPAADPHLPVRYGAATIQGKGRCKRALLQELGLPSAPDRPLLGMVGRLIEQKGADLLAEAIPALAETGARWVVLGTGMSEIETSLRDLAEAHPERVAVRIGFDEGLAHRIQAGSDFLLVPSRFEPCGLTQMYAQRYGTVPIVAAVGGLRDTVVDLAEDHRKGTGICFEPPTLPALVSAVRRGLSIYREKGTWPALRRTIMQQDFSWERSAQRYASLYRQALESPPAAVPPGP